MSASITPPVRLQKAHFWIELTAREHDLARIAEVINAAYRKVKYLQEGVDRITLQEITEYVSDPNKKLYLCMTPSKEICGTILIDFFEQDTAKIGLFAIHPAYQGQNIGPPFMQAVEKATFEKVNRIILDVIPFSQEKLIKFYKCLGYRETGERMAFPEEAKHHYIRPEYRDQISLLIMEKKA